MVALIVIVHVLVCAFLILVILLQAGKGSGMGAAFGGASQTVFGGRGAAPFLAKLTTATAVVFMVTSMTLAYISSQRDDSGLKKKAAEQVAELQVKKATEALKTKQAEEAKSRAAEAASATEALVPESGDGKEAEPAPVGAPTPPAPK